jgi:hypothetical protein
VRSWTFTIAVGQLALKVACQTPNLPIAWEHHRQVVNSVQPLWPVHRASLLWPCGRPLNELALARFASPSRSLVVPTAPGEPWMYAA